MFRVTHATHNTQKAHVDDIHHHIFFLYPVVHQIYFNTETKKKFREFFFFSLKNVRHEKTK